MEPQLSIENIPFAWGIAFVVDVVIGIMTFMLVVRQNVVSWLKGTLTWCGWWSFASALSLIVSVIDGPLSTFSYHQVGVFTETMVNLGLVFWAMSYAFNNWYIHKEDWRQIERLRTELSNKNRMKELADGTE